jgi:hypothetical protein
MLARSAHSVRFSVELLDVTLVGTNIGAGNRERALRFGGKHRASSRSGRL